MSATHSHRLCAALPAVALFLLVSSNLVENASGLTPAGGRAIAVPTGAETAVLLQATPDAVCTLHPEGMTGKAHLMNLFADAEGRIRIHITAHQPSLEPAHMQLDCAATDGRLTTLPLEISTTNSLSMVDRSGALSSALPREAALLPALTEAGQRSLSDQDLAERKYPPRPDAASSPEAYAAWLKLVAQPFTLVPARFVSRPDITHDHGQVKAGTNSTSSNWSGYELRGSGRSYDDVEGKWAVPTVFGESNTHTYSCTWVGLDGDGTSDLIQTGTEQEHIDFLFFSFGSYYAWSELLPNQPTEQEITSVAVNPGDTIYAEVYVGNANGVLNDNGAYGIFFLANQTTGYATSFVTPLSGTYFNGNEAEWIMERPSLGGTLPDLANYLLASMSFATARSSKGATVAYSASNNINIKMYNDYADHSDDNLLSMALPGASTQFFFFWQNFH